MSTANSSFDTPLAIVSMACRLPGANSLAEYWELIRTGSNAIAELPPERLNQRLYYNPNEGVRAKTYSRLGGIVSSESRTIEPFQLASYDVTAADHAHLELLSVAADAIRRAGWDPHQMPSRRTGVYIGHTLGSERAGDLTYRSLVAETAAYLNELPLYRELAGEFSDPIIQSVVDDVQQRYPGRDEHGGPHIEAFQAGRLLNKAFGLDGPYMSLDAACASSLYALASGAMALQLGEIETAIVGGASRCRFDSLLLFSKAGSVSATGTRPFDSEADGLISAEGYVIVVLKTLAAALRDGDPIEAVIRGIGFSSDGKGKSLWAPREEGQLEALRRAYGDSLRMDRVQYLEAHATSTPVGDATEVKALARGLSDRLPAGYRIPLGSVKANIGHTLETAGLAGLLKTVLAIQNRIIPPTPYVLTPNPKVEWNNTPFDLPQTCLQWPEQPDGTPRRAGVNAFGIGGLNAHIVVDEFVPEVAKTLAGVEKSVPPIRLLRGSAPEDALAIIGMGAILPGATDWQMFWERTLQGISGIVPLPKNRVNVDHLGLDPDTLQGGYLVDYQYDWRKHKVPPRQIENADPLQFMMLDAVDQALRHAGYREKNPHAAKTGVIVGSVFSGEFSAQLHMGMRLPEFMDAVGNQLRALGVSDHAIDELDSQYGDLLVSRMPALLDETGSFTSSTLASRCTKTFDWMGGATAIDAGDCSALAALHLADSMLRTHYTDMMIVAAGQRSAGTTTFEKLACRNRLSKDGKLNPLLDPRGTVPGEGVGVLVLKRLSQAQRDGDTVHAVIRSFGVASGQGAVTNMQLSIDRACDAAGVRPIDVSLVESAACGDPYLDPEMLKGLVAALSPNGSEQTKPSKSKKGAIHVRSVADSIGSLNGASAMVATMRAAESVKQKVISPMIQPAGPNAVNQLDLPTGLSVSLSNSKQPLPTTPDQLAKPALVVAAQDETLAYSGIVMSYQRAQSIGSSADREPTDNAVSVSMSTENPKPAESWKIATVGAPTVSELLVRLETIGRDPKRIFDQPEQAFTPADRFRLAIVAESAGALADKIQPAWRGLQMDRNLAHLAVQGIFFGMVSELPNRIAMVMPGQGSQYPGMITDLIHSDAIVAQAAQQIDAVLASLKMPLIDQVFCSEADQLGKDVFRTQLSMLLGDALMMSKMASWGTTADVVIGHSYGELAALFAAGVWDLATVIQATFHRCRSIDEANLPPAALVSVLGNAETLRPLVEKAGEGVWIANRNAPEQTVVGGTIEAVDRFVKLLQPLKLKAKQLPVPCAFHTPLMQPAQVAFAAALEKLRMQPAKVPVLSTVSATYESDPIRLKAGLIHQLVAPIPYVDVIERVVADGCRLLIEVGPGQVLTGLNRRIVADRPDCVTIAMDDPRRGSQRSLACVRAALAVNGRLGALTVRNPAFDGINRSRVSEEAVPATKPPATTVVAEPVETSTLQTPAAEVSSLDRSSNLCESLSDESDHRFSHRPVGVASVATLERPATASKHVRTIELSGTPREMGRQYGEIEGNRIAGLVSLCAGTFGNSGSELPDLADVGNYVDRYFGPHEYEELLGVAEGSGISIENLLALNFWLYPDIDAGCAHFVVPSSVDGCDWWHGANEDLPIGLTLRGPLPRSVCVRRGDQGQPHVLFTVAGQIGSIVGFNDSVLSVSSSMLVDRPITVENRFGLLHGLLVGRILRDAETIDQAVEVISKTKRRGGWGISLLEGRSGKRAYVEYDGEQLRTKTVETPTLLASNHSQLLPPLNTAPSHSTNRLGRLKELFSATPSRFSLHQAQAALRDQHCPERCRDTTHLTMHTLRRVDNQASIVMSPSQAKAWIAVTDPSLFVSQTSDSSTSAAESSDAKPHAYKITQSTVDRFIEIDFRKHGLQGSDRSHRDPDASTSLPARSGDDDRRADYPSIDPQAFIAAGTSVDGMSPVDQSGRVCNRFVYRMVPRPIELDEQLKQSSTTAAVTVCPSDRVLILGDGPLATAIADAIGQLGNDVMVMSTCGDADALIDRLEQHFAATPPVHVIIAEPGPRGMVDLQEAYYRQRQHGLMVPYQLLQWWYGKIVSAKRSDVASCFACFRSSGDFGWSGQIQSVADGALTGLLKGLRLEACVQFRDRFAAATVDFHPEIEVAKAAECFVTEWRLRAGEIEIGYDRRAVRHILRPVDRPLTSDDSASSSANAIDLIEGAWVVTGGARGVTATVAEAIGRRVRGTLHLIGSSSPPQIDPAWCDLDETQKRALRTEVMRDAIAAKQVPAERWSGVEKAIEIQQTLQRLADAGVRCRYWGCDLSDRERLNEVLVQIRSGGEPIVAVIHGAGFEKANKFVSKKFELVQRTVAAKVDGCAALMHLTAGDPLAFFVIFGSISGRFGGVGQTDYCMASEMVAKLGCWFRRWRPGTRVVTLAWHSWADVGMAVRPETKSVKLLSKLRFMPVQEGTTHLIDEIESSSSEPDITIADWRHFKTFFPDPVWKGPFPDSKDLPKTEADSSQTLTKRDEIERAQACIPLLEQQPGEVIATTTLPPSDLMQRFVLRMQPHERKDESVHPLTGSAVIIGNNPDAIAIQNELQRRGIPVASIDSTDPERAIEIFTDLLGQRLPEHLILATARDNAAWFVNGSQRWNLRVESSLMLTFAIVQAWVRAAEKSQTRLQSLSAITCTGGDFGFVSRPLAVEGGAICGLIKSVNVELHRRGWDWLRTKIVDASPAESPVEIASLLFAELCSSNQQVEVGLNDAIRSVPVAIEQSLLGYGKDLPEPDSVWVAAGGGRGITARVALELARRFNLRMHLLGRTRIEPLPEEIINASEAELAALRRQMTRQAQASGRSVKDQWTRVATQLELQRNLKEAEQLGLHVHYHPCDVTDRSELQRTLQSIRESEGDIAAVIQGAGVTFPDRIENKRLERVRNMIDVKLTATKNLIELTRQDPLRFFIGFGSVSGRLGANAASDYAMGADGMCKLIGNLRHDRPEVNAVSVHWHSWGEAGMMLQSASRVGGVLMKLALMPVAEGVEHILREISNGAPESEVLISDRPYVADRMLLENATGFFPAEAQPAESLVARTQEARYPLICGEDRGHSSANERRFRVLLDASHDPFLLQHQFRNRPLMPLVASIEALAEAVIVKQSEASGPIILQDITVEKSLPLEPNQQLDCHVVVSEQDASTEVRLVADFVNRRGQTVCQDQNRVTCIVPEVPLDNDFSRPELAAVGPWYPVEYRQDGPLVHGPAFRALTNICPVDGGLLGRIRAPDSKEILGLHRSGRPLIPMAVVDSCLFACGIHLWITDPTIFGIPMSLEMLRIDRLPLSGELLLAHISLRKRDAEAGLLDFSVWDTSGKMVIGARGYKCALLRGPAS